ncbi:transposase [Corticibacterium sp. UT-5YL-CI-8]|nr:transposase [Tianweitania sp. UT-5YL-CI-8]
MIDAFVNGLDIVGLGFGWAVPASTGRPAYDPRDLLRLYIYSYFNEVRSSCRLERECRRMSRRCGCCGDLPPDFKTIADFRRDKWRSDCRCLPRLCHAGPG